MYKIKLSDIYKFIVSIVVCLIAGFLGSLATRSSIPTWYAGLIKPPFNPPNQLFAPVWTILYILMGVSAFIIWRQGSQDQHVKVALSVFLGQLVLNVLWSIMFFGLRLPLFAFIEIIILWIAILLTILKFRKISITAALLLIPYILWVSFAAILNFSIWRLNS
jgi:benzodiazapine receptor